MGKITGIKSTKCFSFVLIVFCVELSYAKLVSNIDLSSFNFEQIKRDIFLQNGYDLSVVMSVFNSTRDRTCSHEMKKIKIGLENSEDWAWQLLGAWGDISTLSSANSYDLGNFSQCFSLERSGKQYKTKYCVGQFGFKSSSDQKFNPTVDEESTYQTQPTEKVNIGFGLCLPSECSLDMIQFIITKLAQRNENYTSVALIENTCQFEEVPSQLRVIDVIAIVFFGIVLLLILASTFYDIFYSVSGRKKTRAYLAFSFLTNGKKLFSCKKPDPSKTIGCLNGIRAISAIWIVLFHTFYVYRNIPLRNFSDYSNSLAKYYSIPLYSGPLAVESFFVLSGILVTISMLKKLEKDGRIDIISLYLHRYFRLTPLLAVCILFSVSLLRFLESGPAWLIIVDGFGENCEDFWWSSLLYIQNYVNPEQLCLGVTWYLSVDMQLFIISPANIYLIYRIKIKAIYGLSALILANVFIYLGVYFQYDSLDACGKLRSHTYVFTHYRYASYCIAIIAGYFLFKTQDREIRIPKVFNLLAWTLSLSTLAAVSVFYYPFMKLVPEATQLEYGLHDSLSSIFWSIALCWIIFACVHNYGGPINWFQAHPLWQPLSRLSYSIYLFHFLVVMEMSSTKTAAYFTELTAFYAFLINLASTLTLATIATLAFEFPAIAIEGILFKKTG